MSLSFKKLDVYKLSVEFLDLSFRLQASLPKGQAKVADQLKRAAMSIPLNIAEGVGKTSCHEAAHHFAISRGSAMECSAIMDVVRIGGFATRADIERGEQMLERLVAMLTRMCRKKPSGAAAS